MINLTKLNGETFTLNALMVEQIQSHPDTTITLVNGKKMVVNESESEVKRLTTVYFQQIGLYGSVRETGVNDE
ncbi:flagellar protein FlbD [Lentibacillus lipolyticus]|nr:flagellar protein FlbD [Lentibacillus lipolyticus]